MAELPIGTVTFLFTDIEDSTGLVKRLRGEYDVRDPRIGARPVVDLLRQLGIRSGSPRGQGICDRFVAARVGAHGELPAIGLICAHELVKVRGPLPCASWRSISP